MTARGWIGVACALVLWLQAGATCASAPPGGVAVVPGTIQVLFTPGDDIEGAVVEALRAARQEVLVQAFSFTSRPIARALIDAHARGVRVRVSADATESTRGDNSRLPDLAAAGIPVLVDDRFQSAHNKVMVIDAATSSSIVITGSFNWTYAAQRRNAENVVILRAQRAVAARFRENWERLADGARPFGAR